MYVTRDLTKDLSITPKYETFHYLYMLLHLNCICKIVNVINYIIVTKFTILTQS